MATDAEILRNAYEKENKPGGSNGSARGHGKHGQWEPLTTISSD